MTRSNRPMNGAGNGRGTPERGPSGISHRRLGTLAAHFDSARHGSPCGCRIRTISRASSNFCSDIPKKRPRKARFMSAATDFLTLEIGRREMRVRTRLALAGGVGTLISAPVALAHEGHGNPAFYGSILHFLSEPMHLLATLAILGAMAVASRWASRGTT